MEAPLSSPDDRMDPPSRKITYSGAKKRKRNISNTVDSDSDSNSAPESIKSFSAMATPSPKKTQPPKSSSRRGPKKVDVNLPGPSPVKRTQQDSNESAKSSKSTTKRHARTVSSITDPLLRVVTQQVSDSPSAKKPESKKQEITGLGELEFATTFTPKPRSRAKSIAAEEDFDDNASIADSIISVTKTRRNEVERIEYYKNQPECGILEPHAAQCTRCNKVVKLGRKQTYAVRPWELHRVRCDQKPAQATQPASVPVEQSPLPRSPKISSAAGAVDASSSTLNPTPARRPSEQDRKTFLESEKQIKRLEKNRALCAKCDQWIALSEVTAYTSGNWMKHKIKCFDAVPSNRVAAAKRKLLLVNDRQIKSFTSRTVDCNNCGTCVTLEGEGDFNLALWEAHKEHCTKSIPIPRSEGPNNIAFPSRSSRPTVFSGSVPAAAECSTSSGVKRSRDEADETSEEAQPAVRQKLGTYLPPQVEPPSSLLGWFMLPFSSFARGFKESLRDRP